MLIAVSFCHLLNDTMQSLLPSIYPILKTAFHLDFGQIGLLTLTFQMTASILQPFVGLFTDRKPLPYSLPAGMVFTLAGLLLLAIAPSFPLLLLAASLIGMGSAVFHPESSRVARLASGGRLRPGSVGLPGRRQYRSGDWAAAGCFYCAAARATQCGVVFARGVAAIMLLFWVSRWYKAHLRDLRTRPAKAWIGRQGCPKGEWSRLSLS